MNKTRTLRKIQVKPEALVGTGAVTDILQCLSTFTPSGRKSVLDAVKVNFRLVETADTPDGETRCVDKMTMALIMSSGWGARDVDNARAAIRQCIRQLLHYRQEIREQMLCAALIRADETATQQERLRQMLPQVQKALRDLPPQHLALNHLVATLWMAGYHSNIPLREEAIKPARTKGKANMDALRDNPKMHDLVSAYDLADSINETY